MKRSATSQTSLRGTATRAALVFWQASARNYLIVGGEIDEILAHPEMVPETAVERALAEDGHHNTWKAIEALTGRWDFRTEKILRAELIAANVDPDIVIRWSDGTVETLGQRLWKLRLERNNLIAHGSPPSSPKVPRGTTLIGLSRAQTLAGIAIRSALGMPMPGDDAAGADEGRGTTS